MHPLNQSHGGARLRCAGNPLAPAWKRTALNSAVAAALSGLAVAPIFAQAAPCATSVSTSVTGCTVTAADTLSVADTGTITSTAGVSVTVDDAATGVTVTNAGTIGDGAALSAILVDSGATGTQITNHAGGVIAATGNGNSSSALDAVRFSGNLDGSLTNNSTITSSYAGASSTYARGILIDGSLTGALSNGGTGTISASTTANDSNGATAWGVCVNGSVFGIFTNGGTIAASATNDDALGEAQAMGVYGAALFGIFANSGTVTATATASNSAHAGGAVFGGIGAGGSLTNSSTITARATAGNSAYAGGAVVAMIGAGGSLANSGTITASATAGNNAYAGGVYIDGIGAGGSFSNSGTITASATAGNNAYAGGVYIDGIGAGGSFSNSGAITASATAGNNAYAGGVYIDGIAAGGSLTNSGSIVASAVSGNPDNAYVFGVYAQTSLDGTLNNSGSISATAFNPAQGVSMLIAGGNGTINNLAGSLLSGNLYVGGTVAVNNAGTIAIPAEANGAAAAGISGNYTQTSSGTLSIGVASPTVYGQLLVGGTADFTASNKLYVNVRNGASLVAGSTVLSGVLTAGTLNGSTFSVTDNSLMYDFVAVQNGTAIDLGVTAGSSPVSSVVTTGSSYALGAASVFEGLVSNSTGDMTSVMTAMGTLSTNQQVSDAIKQTLPLMVGGMSRAALDVLHNTNQAIQGRLEARRGLSSGDNYLSDKRFWFKPFGSRADQDDRNGVAGYKSRSTGFALGSDAEFSRDTRLGLAFAYSDTRVNGNSSIARQSAGIDAYQVAFYGSHALGADLNLDFQVDVGANKNEGRRTISFGGLSRRAASSYSSVTTHVGAGIGKGIKLGEADVITPSVRLDYTNIRDRAYTESGAEALNLAVGAKTTQELVALASAKVTRSLDAGKTLVANLGVGYDLMAKQNSITANFVGGGATFATAGIEPKPWLLRGGAGLVIHGDNKIEVTARYDIESRRGFSNQTASLNMRMPF